MFIRDEEREQEIRARLESAFRSIGLLFNSDEREAHYNALDSLMNVAERIVLETMEKQLKGRTILGVANDFEQKKAI